MTLVVEDLTVRYSDTVAVDSVTFDIAAGECVGLVGESGAGKSTVGLAIPGLAGDRRGSIRFEGTELVGADTTTLRSVRGSEIGLAFQDADDALHPAYTVGEQIAESIDGSHRRWRRHENRVESILSTVELEKELVTRYPHQLSGGQKQRALLAVALADEPELLIADEPTSSLDTVTKASVLETLETLTATEACSMLLITHDLGVVERTCDRTLVMRDGELQDRGQTETLLTNPAHPYTADLVTARQYNIPAVDGGTPSTTPVIAALDSVTKQYADNSILSSLFGLGEQTTALRDCSLSIHRGETVAVVGRSGAGKTTAARLLAGLETPTSGAVRLQGETVGPVQERSENKRGAVGYVFQSPHASFDPRRTVAQSVGEPLRAAGWDDTRRQDRIDQLLDSVGLSGFEDRYPRELSGGECQRAGIARALALDPDLLVLDEATSALDTLTTDRLCSLFERLRREYGLSIFVVTHDFGIARRLADRTLVVDDGEIVERGGTATLLAEPTTDPTRVLVESALTEI